MGYVKDWYQVRTGEVLSSVFLQSKLVDVEKTFANAMKARQDIAGIIVRLNLLKRTAKSKSKSAQDIANLEKGIMSIAQDELLRIFTIVESDMLMLHDLMEFLHEIVRINNEISREKAAQSKVKFQFPTIKSIKDRKKAEKKIEDAKKQLESSTNDAQRLLERKKVAAEGVNEIRAIMGEIKRELTKFRNQFDAMRRSELRRVA